MNMKKMFPEKKDTAGRIRDFIDKKGFYVVLILCVAVIAVTAVTAITRNTRMDFGNEDNIFVEPDNITGSQAIAGEKSGIAGNSRVPELPKAESIEKTQTPIKQSESSVALEPVSNDNKPKNTQTAVQGSTAENKKETAVAPAKPAQTTSFKPSTPVVGNMLVEYAQDKLVFNKTLQEWTTHSGVDIAAERGVPVKAVADGVVSSIKNDPRYGITIIIDHQNSFKSVYANLAADDMVQPNQKVKQGETIGAVGTTAGFESGDQPHLHFEILKNNALVNPMDHLPK